MGIAIGIIVAVIVIFGLMFNTLVGRKNQVKNAFGSIDTMLNKRYDLIPNLIAAVKNYMQHEKSLLTELTALRAKATQGNLSDDDRVDLDNKITKTMGGIMVAVENYPDLKASENFLQLQRAMNEVEEQISASRRAFNAAVTDYNNSVEMLPTNIIAAMIGYKTKNVFEITEEKRQNIDADALFKA